VSADQKPEIQVILPVHNEEECIESVLTEIYSELSPRLAIEFIISEDGSQDRTKEILQDLSQRFPMQLILGENRKGYSQAVIDGLKTASSDYVFALDSDGQFSPKDFWKLYEKIGSCDVCIGWRKPRMDSFLRKSTSKFFKAIYQMLFHVPVHDPSCVFFTHKERSRIFHSG